MIGRHLVVAGQRGPFEPAGHQANRLVSQQLTSLLDDERRHLFVEPGAAVDKHALVPHVEPRETHPSRRLGSAQVT